MARCESRIRLRHPEGRRDRDSQQRPPGPLAGRPVLRADVAGTQSPQRHSLHAPAGAAVLQQSEIRARGVDGRVRLRRHPRRRQHRRQRRDVPLPEHPLHHGPFGRNRADARRTHEGSRAARARRSTCRTGSTRSYGSGTTTSRTPASRGRMAAMRAFMPESQILFGTDYSPEPMSPRSNELPALEADRATSRRGSCAATRSGCFQVRGVRGSIAG